MTLTTTESGRKVLRLTHGFRVAFFLIAAFILFGTFSTGGLALFPAILIVFSVLALLYDERWIFDAQDRTVTRLFGLLFLHSRRTYSLDEAEYIEYGSFVEGSAMNRGSDPTPKRRTFQRQFETLTLVMANGDRVDLDKHRGRDTGRLQEIGERLAEYCRLPLQAS